MRKHKKFILTPIASILDEGCAAMAFLNDGMESFPVGEYMMQSLFLKMTGFQEQKVKSILWELATDSYELRYSRYQKDGIGEASTYDDKMKVFQDLTGLLRLKMPDGMPLLTDVEKENIMSETMSYMNKLSIQHLLKGWMQRQYDDFRLLFGNCGKECLLFVGGKKCSLFGHCENCTKKSKAIDGQICKISSLKEIYNSVYRHRNRCAHNTVSYQQNLPSLEMLQSKEYVFENYFVRFAMLMLIDMTFVKLFEKYLAFMPEPFEI